MEQPSEYLLTRLFWDQDQTIERRKTESNLRQGIKHFRDGQPRSPSPMAPFKTQSPRGQRRSPRDRRDSRGV
eukprot:33378-Amphidinium_carterae.1